MKNVADTYHLQLRGKTWYYLRRVPNDLLEVVGKPVIKFSLETSHKGEAKRLRSVQDVKHDALFDQLRKGTAGTSDDPQLVNVAAKRLTLPLEQLTRYVQAAVKADDSKSYTSLLSDPPKDEDELQEMRIDAHVALAILTSSDDPRRDEMVVSFGKKILKAAGSEPPSDQNLLIFNETVRRGLVEVFRRKIDRYDNRLERPFHDVLFNPDRPHEKIVCFAELARTYLKEKGEEFEINLVSQKRRDKVTSLVDTLVEIVGVDTPVRDMGDEVVQHVRSVLARLPANRGKFYPGVSATEAIEKAHQEGRRSLSPTTQGFYLDTLRDMLRLAVKRKLISENAAVDVRPLKKQTIAVHERRRPLRPDQLKAFFTSEFYERCAPGAINPYLLADRPWRFWLPLIMLFSGARPNEIAQLKVSDVKTSPAGTTYLDLRGDQFSSPIQVKTQSSLRRIPLHKELLKLGFFSFVQNRRSADGEAAELFPSLKPDRYGNRAWYAVKRFNERYLPMEIVLEERQSLYSLRHNVRDALRRISAPPEALQAIAGWSAGKQVSDHYGDPGNPDFFTGWVNGIEYNGLDLSFLYERRD